MSVIDTGEESYVAVDKGAITDSHVLVLPIEHWPSSLHLSASAYSEMERYLSALRSCFAAKVQPTHLSPLKVTWATRMGASAWHVSYRHA